MAEVSHLRGGRVGLVNLGNTCFMNAALQCLSHIEPVSAYFLTSKYAEEINTTNPFGSGGHLARAFAKLQEQLWQQSSRTQSPKRIHRTLAKFAPHLTNTYQQQDVQELLAYLMDGLHEDLSLIKERPEVPTSTSTAAEGRDEEHRADIAEEELRAQEELEREKGEEYVAALAWMHHLTRHKSFLVDLFQGQLRSRLTCSKCGCVSKTFDPYLYMSLPVHDGMGTLEEALRGFLADETLSDKEQWKCPRCRHRVNATKKIDIWKLPPVLVVHLKRFEYDMRTSRFRKIQAHLKSPLTVDLAGFVTAEQREPQVYDIVCIANHSGQYGSGHYTATCRHPIDGRFYHFNDELVEEVRDEAAVLSSQAYVLFLVRQASRGHLDTLERQSVTRPEVWPHAVSKTNSLMLPAVWDVLSGRRRSLRQAASAMQEAPEEAKGEPEVVEQ